MSDNATNRRKNYAKHSLAGDCAVYLGHDHHLFSVLWWTGEYPESFDSGRGIPSGFRVTETRVTIVDINGKVVFYAGRGPWDFKLSPVERTLKELITYGGHMPPLPKPQWGQTVNGLRCGLTIDPKNVVLGEPVAAKLQFENMTRKPINFYFQAADALKHIVIENNNR